MSDGDETYPGSRVRLLLPWTSRAAAPPVVVWVAGQPGAGKTAAGDLLQAVLERRGPVVRVCSDLYKTAHPDYAALLAADVRLAGAGVRSHVRSWQAAVEDHVRAHGLDAVVETALADADEARAASVTYQKVAGSNPSSETPHAVAITRRAYSAVCARGGIMEHWNDQTSAASRTGSSSPTNHRTPRRRGPISNWA